MELFYIMIAFIIFIGIAIYERIRKELKVTKLKESHKKTVKSLMELNKKLQLRVIELEKYKKLKITLDKEAT